MTATAKNNKNIITAYRNGFRDGANKGALPALLLLVLFALLLGLNPLQITYINEPWCNFFRTCDPPVAATLSMLFYVAILVYGIVAWTVAALLGVYLSSSHRATREFVWDLAAENLLGLNEEKEQ